MNNTQRLFFIVISLMLTFSSSIKAQVPLPQRGVKSDQHIQPQQSSRQLDEQLARSFLNNKEYDKAADLYNNLYSKYNYYHYFSQYIECLLYLEKYEEVKASLK